MAKQDTIKFLNEKVKNTGDISDYKKIPLGVDSVNVDRTDGSTAEENFVNVDNGVNIGRTLKYEDPYLYLLDGEGTKLSRVMLVLPSHTHKYVEEITKEATYAEAGLKTFTCACGDSYTEEIPMLVDSVSPTGTITIGDNTYTSLVENPAFDTYFKTAQNVTIEGVDNESGVKGVFYFVSDAKIDETGLADVAWVAYDGGFTVEPNQNAIVYAKITDNQDNVTYICSDGIVLDDIAPVFNGMEDGGTYDIGATLTVQDGETLFVNGTEVELVNNTYTFNTEDNYLLSIKDRAGNESNINITIHHEEEYEKWDYTLNEDDETITLNYYKGDEADVTVHGQYKLNDSGKIYKTKLTNNANNKNYMFAGNKNVKTVSFDNDLDTSNCTNMNYMFYNCTSLHSVDFGINFNTSNVTSMVCMFYYCLNLESVNLTSFDTSKVSTMMSMFNNCRTISSLDLTNFNISYKNTYMSFFVYNCLALETIYVSINKWLAADAFNNTDSMFDNCIVQDVTYKDSTGAIVSDIAPESETRSWEYTLDDEDDTITLLKCNIDNNDVRVYSRYKISESGKIYNARLGKKANNGCMFDNRVKTVTFSDDLNTSTCTDMSYMFQNSNIESINFGNNFDTSNVVNMTHMFENCKYLQTLDLTNFNTSNVTDMSYMFNCSYLQTLDLTNFNTSNVTDMSYMFGGSIGISSLENKLESLNLLNFDTSNVTDMSYMFENCKYLQTLDLTSFNTLKATEMKGMFWYCSGLKNVYVTKDQWITLQANTSNMFRACNISSVTYKNAA